ncbi:putative diphthamide synthesis protein-domain-containing protein [Dipodascopsis tothii]|uniref:putative diphthamide synthesis protein-domain-containing protein n=1 Tax=Dipodascopsis tothii TaxID=44089 RepID=UPI0034CEA112
MESAPALSTPTDYARVSRRHTGSGRSPAELERAYSLQAVCEAIADGGYRRIALQFPDKLLPDSVEIQHLIRGRLAQLDAGEAGAGEPAETLVFILGDTSYSECCVDEIAGEHVGADAIVHFGTACLSPTQRVPVIYVFTQHADEAVVDAVVAGFAAAHDRATPAVLMADVELQSVLEAAHARLAADGYSVVATRPKLPPSPAAIRFVPPTATGPASFLNRTHEPLDRPLSEHALFHIGAPTAPLLLHLSTLFAGCTVWPVDGAAEPSLVPLKRRYRAVLAARAAPTIGIVVNTLSISTSLAVMDALKKLITDAGKKHYTVVVGKINVAKLANFDVVECWVVVGCQQGGIILDQDSQYYRPLVTPFELAVALAPFAPPSAAADVVWGASEWVVDLEKVTALVAATALDGAAEDDAEDASGDRPPEFDLLTGRYVAARPLAMAEHRAKNHLDIEFESAGSVVPRPSGQLTVASVAGTVSTAAELLQTKRFWTGLGADLDDDAPSVLEAGRTGIARDYDLP